MKGTAECLQEVHIFKSFYQIIEKEPKWRAQLCVIGIGAGSKKRSVARFRKSQEIPFPLLSDERWELFKCLGNPVLPVSYLLKRDGNRRKIVMIQSGHVKSGDVLMMKVKSAITTGIPD